MIRIRNMSNCSQLNIDQVDKYADIFKALSNPNRLRILLELTRCPEGSDQFTTSQDQVENCQQEFAKMLGLAPSTVSHHFKELRNAGLVKVQRQGKNIMVQVDKEVLETIKSLF